MSVQTAPDSASILTLDLWSRVLALVQADVLGVAKTHEMNLSPRSVTYSKPCLIG